MAENYEKVEHVWGNECKENPKCTNDCLDDCIPQPGFRVDLNEVKRVALFHYVTRYSMPNSEPFRFFDVSLAIVQHTAQTSAFRNLFIISKRDPANTPEYSEFLYLCGNTGSSPLHLVILAR